VLVDINVSMSIHVSLQYDIILYYYSKFLKFIQVSTRQKDGYCSPYIVLNTSTVVLPANRWTRFKLFTMGGTCLAYEYEYSISYHHTSRSTGIDTVRYSAIGYWLP
jgi:hypothetical protein